MASERESKNYAGVALGSVATRPTGLVQITEQLDGLCNRLRDLRERASELHFKLTGDPPPVGGRLNKPTDTPVDAFIPIVINRLDDLRETCDDVDTVLGALRARMT